jgi:2-keto-myo-inositol isomerase
MTRAEVRRGTPGLHLNGATIMTTRTEALLEIARDAGYVGVEIRAERLLGPDATAELSATAGAVRPGEVWSLNGIQIKVGADGTLRRDLLEAELVPRLSVCQATGASYLLVVPPRIGAVDAEHALPGVTEGLARIRDEAAAVGVRAAFEFLGFADCPIDSPELAARLAEAVPGTDLVIDSCHWHASGSQALDGFPLERLAMVHLNDAPAKPPREVEDADRLLPGLGVIRLPELVAALLGGGYTGPWSLETFNPAYWSEDPREVAHRGMASTQQILAAAGAA